jgi:hypothetical protein
MNIEGGESLQSTKVKIADVLVRGLQFTLVVDLDELEYQRSRLDKNRARTFQIAEVKLSGKEYTCWGPIISMANIPPLDRWPNKICQ